MLLHPLIVNLSIIKINNHNQMFLKKWLMIQIRVEFIKITLALHSVIVDSIKRTRKKPLKLLMPREKSLS